MLLLEIILYEVLQIVSAPRWCFLVLGAAFLWSCLSLLGSLMQMGDEIEYYDDGGDDIG